MHLVRMLQIGKCKAEQYCSCIFSFLFQAWDAGIFGKLVIPFFPFGKVTWHPMLTKRKESATFEMTIEK
ncbi:hypothetical protein T4D_8492 [Trichinella pseudospiralis]|uniref:Uncharacterized protein n=1 Tax=Trichinella pseudospiralis TaxID=6337 RepID=A0A0V1FUT6_TRIPS|nr:hypothetical protein T4D_8492 [Trichinella pseudospiralis]